MVARSAVDMRRREFVSILGCAAVWPLPLSAQQPVTKIPRIGIIDDSVLWNSFRRGLRDLGYLEGQNVAFEYRYADGAPEILGPHRLSRQHSMGPTEWESIPMIPSKTRTSGTECGKS